MTHKEFKEFLAGKEITYLDGGCGSNLQKRGLPQVVCPEYWMCENIDVIRVGLQNTDEISNPENKESEVKEAEKRR